MYQQLKHNALKTINNIFEEMRNVCFSHINEVSHILNNAEFCSCQNNLHAVTSLPWLFPLIVGAQRGQLHKCIYRNFPLVSVRVLYCSVFPHSVHMSSPGCTRQWTVGNAAMSSRRDLMPAPITCEQPRFDQQPSVGLQI